MSEKLPTRREADNKNVEKSEKYQALKTLTDAGLLIKMGDLELYHGRSGGDGNWKVKADFDNAGNNTGHRNVNKIPALSASHLEVASDFAQSRAHSRKGSPEVHRVISDDPDACIFDIHFSFSELDENEREAVLSAIAGTAPGITVGAPIDFAHRDALRGVLSKDFVKDSSTGLTFEEDLTKNAEKFHFDEDFNRKIVSARNTNCLLKNYPASVKLLMIAFLENEDSITVQIGDKERTIPISREYLASWFREMHIVGCRVKVNSVTLNKKVENFLLFDLEKINTTSEIEKRKKKVNRRLGKIAVTAEKRRSSGKLAETLAKDLYIKPQEIISLAKTTPGYKEKFEADAGNWEGFTLEEHIETVLRLFEENYADSIPAALLPIMRLALLVHDIGKSEAAKNHGKKNQKDYNLKYAEDFMEKNGIKPANRELILAIIGEGLELTGRWVFKEDPEADRKLDDFSKRTLKKFLGKFFVNSDTITGFRRLLEILQMCDSAAYTTMGITRSKSVYYRNNNSFGKSFKKPNPNKPHSRPRKRNKKN